MTATVDVRTELARMARAWVWLESGDWVSKPAAEAWLRDRVRRELEARR